MIPEVQEARVVPAGEFKAKCLQLMDEVNSTGIPIVITKRGKPVSRLVPPGGDGKGICGMFPELAGFWDDPGETVVDPESVAAMADDWA